MLKIRVARDLFLKTLQIVDKSISDNKIRPVIGGVYIEARNNRIYMRGTNLELTINSIMDGEIFEEGSMVFPFTIIDEYLRQINESMIDLVEEEGKLVINTGNATSEFSIYDVNDYPNVKIYDENGGFEIPVDLMTRAFDKTRIAADISGENLAMNCIRLEIDSGKLKTIASDSFRMVYFEEELAIPENKEVKVSVPLKTVDSILKIMKLTGENSLILKYEGNQILFKIGKTDIMSRIIELEFPNYKSVLGGFTSDKTVIMKTDEFISTLKRVQIFARNNLSAKNGSIFLFSGNKLILRAISENAKVKEEIETIKEGDDMKISLNVKFLLDYAALVEKETIELKLNGSNNPVLIKGEKEEKFIYLTMPLALSEE